MKKKPILLAAVAAALSFLALAPTAKAQTSAALLIKPWEAKGAAESTTDFLALEEGHAKETGDSYQLSELESQGRLRLLPGHEASPRFGYDFLLLNSHTSEHGNAFQRGMPSQLIDACVAGGTFVYQQNGWVYGMTLGVGYAGDRAFGDGRAWYGRGTFVVAKKFSEFDALGIGLDYDGHRSYLPDCPLPGFGYSHTFDPHLDMVIGAPLTSITWKPSDQWRFYFDMLILDDFDVDISYQFIKHWSVFTSLQTKRDQFYISQLHDHTRLLYVQRRVEGGIRFSPMDNLTLKAAIGYAFATDFRRGWDYRSSSQYVYLTNEPYISFAVEFSF